MEPRTTPIKPGTHNVQPRLSSHDSLDELDRAERAQENDYFRKLDRELILALREKSAQEMEQAIRTYTRRRCPKCGDLLEETLTRRVKLDACRGCGGIWLDQGEWEMLVGSTENGWIRRLFDGLLGTKH